MPAVPYVVIADVVNNMIFQCEVSSLLDDLVGVLEDYLSDNPTLEFVGMDEHDRNEMLGIVTGMTVATGTVLNCYPRGAETALYYDLDGNRVDP